MTTDDGHDNHDDQDDVVVVLVMVRVNKDNVFHAVPCEDWNMDG